MMLLAVSAFAQTGVYSDRFKGAGFGRLLGDDNVNIELDFSNLKINNMETAVSARIVAKEQEKLTSLFLTGLNDKTRDVALAFGSYPDAGYKFVVRFDSFVEKNALSAHLDYIDVKSRKTIGRYILKCRAGRFGGTIELLEEAFQRLGERLGDEVTNTDNQ